jgi:DNA invertase Pin-like site-specific DNA recombinase
MASLAEFERALIAERVKAGMARAKAQGKHVGRPRIPLRKKLRSAAISRPGAACIVFVRLRPAEICQHAIT